jgi:hypothetical protein
MTGVNRGDSWEKPGRLIVNIIEQTNLASAIHSLTLNMTVAFKVDAKHIQFGKVLSFTDINASLQIFLSSKQNDKITFELTDEVNTIVINRESVIRTEISFTKQKTLKKVIAKHFQDYIII